MEIKPPHRWFSGEKFSIADGYAVSISGAALAIWIGLDAFSDLPLFVKVNGIVMGVLCVWKGGWMLGRSGR